MDTASSYIDLITSVSTTLEEFNHPFTIVGQAANRWMGSNGCYDDAIDLLLRDDQLTPITLALVQSGKWDYFDLYKDRHDDEDCYPEFLEYGRDADQVLERKVGPNDMWCFLYIRIWSEKAFHLKVDGVSWFKAPNLFTGWPTVVEDRFHPAADRTDGWFFGPNLLSHCDQSRLSPHPLDGISILVPSIPSYLNAMVYHATQYKTAKPQLSFMSKWQIRNLTRYLYLELPECRHRVLLEVDADAKQFLGQFFDKYKRKPLFNVNKSGEVVEIKPWVPQS